MKGWIKKLRYTDSALAGSLCGAALAIGILSFGFVAFGAMSTAILIAAGVASLGTPLLFPLGLAVAKGCVAVGEKASDLIKERAAAKEVGKQNEKDPVKDAEPTVGGLKAGKEQVKTGMEVTEVTEVNSASGRKRSF